MKRITKILFILIALLTLCLTVFFFWASAPNLEAETYSQLILNNHSSPKNSDSIYSIVTYNIGYLSGMTNNLAVEKPKKMFDDNLQKVISETKKINPDIIAFQEIDYHASRSYDVNQETEIAKLGYNYVAKGVNWDERYVPFPYWPPSLHFGKTVSGQSILSKYLLKDYERIVLDRVADAPFYRDALYLDRLAQVAKVVLEKKEVVLINVHLEAFDGDTRQKQFRYVVDSLFKRYKNKYPTILLGDFNSPARDEKAVIKELFLMDDVGNAAFDPKNPANTFDTKSLYQRIDYIFYTKNTIEYVDGRVLNEFGQTSDHLPVMMRFKLKK